MLMVTDETVVYEAVNQILIGLTLGSRIYGEEGRHLLLPECGVVLSNRGLVKSSHIDSS